MNRRNLNVFSCELDESLDRAGFRHAVAAIGHRIGADRLGAAVYEVEAGHPIWPYHYHHDSEEWLYVISGAPAARGHCRAETWSAFRAATGRWLMRNGPDADDLEPDPH
jgi:uncharacterized cupin superfamily protein